MLLQRGTARARDSEEAVVFRHDPVLNVLPGDSCLRSCHLKSKTQCRKVLPVSRYVSNDNALNALESLLVSCLRSSFGPPTHCQYKFPPQSCFTMHPTWKRCTGLLNVPL